MTTDGAQDTGRADGRDLADRIAEAVTECPDVASLAGGRLGAFLPGRGAAGVSVHDTGVEVAVVARYGRPMPEIADEVRDAVEPLVPGLPVDVSIDDITEAAAPGQDSGAPETTPPRSTGEGDGNG
jgi:uncharacterized alkaline shock family protein YloU